MMSMPASAFFALPVAPSLNVEAAFFTALKTGNNTFKKTSAGRFKALDAALVRHLRAKGSMPGEMLDIGISSGITTLELDAALSAARQSLRLTATDLSLEASIVPTAKGCRALIDRDGHVLQHEILGRAVRPWRRRLDYFDGMILLRAVINRLLVPRARAALAAGHICSKVELISPRLRRRRDITVRQDDVTTRNPQFVRRFDAIRAANILNRDYFDNTTLRRALGNVSSYLVGPGSLMLVARTHADGTHHGTLFEVAEDGGSLQVVDRFGSGSEVEALALQSYQPVRH